MNTLVILGHPTPNSLCGELAERYATSAHANGATVTRLNLAELDFAAAKTVRYGSEQTLEPDLQHAQSLIDAADHLVFVYPTWWTLMPALLKGFFDRVFLPGFAFQYQQGKPLPKKLLTGKSARLLVTMDSPWVWYRFVMGRPGHKAVKRGILQFCGVSPVKVTNVGPVRGSKPKTRTRWLEQSAHLAQKDIHHYNKHRK